MNKQGLLQECKVGLKFKSQEIKLLTEQKGKTICSSLQMQKKAFDRIQYPFRINEKKNSQTRNEKDFFKLIRDIYKKLTANIIFYGENLMLSS